MKKYVIGIIATMALLTVGCSDESSEQLMDVTSSTPMTFAVDEEALTRLNYINSVLDLQEFTIVAQVDGEIYKQGNFKYNATTNTIEPTNGETWLWPGDENKEVTFYATNDLDWIASGIDISDPIVDDERSFNNRLGTNDMICAYTTTSRTNCMNGVVHLDFSHALAEVGILFRGEFPAGAAVSYRIYTVDVQGEYEQVYNFRTNTWSKKAGGDQTYHSYFAEDNGFGLFDTNGDYVELLMSEQQEEGDTFRFLQPGTYDIHVSYLQDNDYKDKTAMVELTQGQKNRIQLTLPYE